MGWATVLESACTLPVNWLYQNSIYSTYIEVQAKKQHTKKKLQLLQWFILSMMASILAEQKISKKLFWGKYGRGKTQPWYTNYIVHCQRLWGFTWLCWGLGVVILCTLSCMMPSADVFCQSWGCHSPACSTIQKWRSCYRLWQPCEGCHKIVTSLLQPCTM